MLCNMHNSKLSTSRNSIQWIIHSSNGGQVDNFSLLKWARATKAPLGRVK